MASLLPSSYNERNQRNIEMSMAIEDWSEYVVFGRKVVMDKTVRKMKGARVHQLQSCAYGESHFWRLHYQCDLVEEVKGSRKRPYYIQRRREQHLLQFCLPQKSDAKITSKEESAAIYYNFHRYMRPKLPQKRRVAIFYSFDMNGSAC